MRRLFSESGLTFDGASREGGAALSSALTPKQFRRFSVINLGYIEATLSEDYGQAWLRPSIVAPAARAAFLYWAGSFRSHEWLVSTFDERWMHQTAVGFGALRGLIQQLISDDGKGANRFSSRELRSHELPAVSSPAILLSKWAAGDIKLNEILSTLDQLNGRYLIAEFNALDDSVTLLGVGADMLLRQKASGWCSLASGVAIEDHPDQAYGAWVARSFRDCARRRRPSLEEVRVTVTWPVGTTSHVYRRAIAPIPISDSRVLLISSSLVDETREISGCAS